jgi:glycosyltransferase involved in cell wall biosynthesis
MEGSEGRGVILVDIPMCTYNHEKHIAQAIEGVLMQRTNFRYRLIIGEDCSTDRTREIVVGYAERNPDKIEAVLHPKNVGAHANSKVLFGKCTAKYIALCDGDDYWTDPGKLQTQVDFLESNSDFASCYHNVLEDHEQDPSKSSLFCPPDQPAVCLTTDLLSKGNVIPTCSNVYRRKLVPMMPVWVQKLGMGDWPLNIMLSQLGQIKYFNRVMGVYRVHSSGMWSTGTAIEKELSVLQAYDAFLDHISTSNNERTVIRQRINALIRGICAVYVQVGQRAKAVKFLLDQVVRHPEFFFRIYFLQCLKLLLVGVR